MRKDKLLITGGAGYIGAHTIVELLAEGYQPIVIDNFSKSNDTLLKGIEKLTGEKVIFYPGDCTDTSFLHSVFSAEKTIAGVIHFAAFKSVSESVQKPLIYYQNNVNSVLSLAEVMALHKVRYFIFSSSCTVYGEPDEIPIKENAPFKKARSPYGASKQICEQILESLSGNHFHAISLRYFNPIGAHHSSYIGELPIDTPTNLVPYMTQTARGKYKQLIVFGDDYDTPDGTCIRDYIHVSDIAQAHVKAWEFLHPSSTQAMPYHVYNIGLGHGTSVMQLIRAFQQVTNVSLSYAIGSRRPGDVTKIYADSTVAQSALNWTPQYTIHDALLHAWKWEKKLANQ